MTVTYSARQAPSPLKTLRYVAWIPSGKLTNVRKDVLHKTPGLWDHEVAVVSKFIREVKLKRKSFARGKYYGPTIYQAHSVLSARAVAKVPVHAAFLSMPVFAVLPSAHSGLQNESRPTASHPRMQSFWQYLSMSFGDEDAELPYWNDCDRRSSREQVITKFARDTADEGGYIHVPEFWALTISMCEELTLTRKWSR